MRVAHCSPVAHPLQASSPYEGGVYLIDFKFPAGKNNTTIISSSQLTITSTDYPIRAPTVTFITKIYHPNVDAKGNICMEIFGKTWNPTMNAANSML